MCNCPKTSGLCIAFYLACSLVFNFMMKTKARWSQAALFFTFIKKGTKSWCFYLKRNTLRFLIGFCWNVWKPVFLSFAVQSSLARKWNFKNMLRSQWDGICAKRHWSKYVVMSKSKWERLRPVLYMKIQYFSGIIWRWGKKLNIWPVIMLLDSIFGL